MAEAKVGVVMGSDSDWEVMSEAVKVLAELGIPVEVEQLSAHRTPDLARDYAMGAENRGLKVIIAGAGHAAHLAGSLAAHTAIPVLGVPLASSDLKGLDALLSTVQMPPGVPVGTLAIGKAGARNAAILAAQILATADEKLGEKVKSLKTELAKKVQERSQGIKKQAAELISRLSPKQPK